VWVQVTYDDGTNLKIKLPVETWMQKATYDMPLPTTKKIAEVTIDPEHRIPDNACGNQRLAVLTSGFIPLSHASP
jgi:hypothetical protein